MAEMVMQLGPLCHPPCLCWVDLLSLIPRKSKPCPKALRLSFQPVNDPSAPAFIEAVNKVLRAYEYAPASEPKLTSLSEVLEATKGLGVLKPPGLNSVLNRALRHLPKRVITCL